MKLKDYKGYEIDVDMFGEFTADGIDESSSKLEILIEAIDKAAKIKYKPVDGYRVNVWSDDGVENVTVTRPSKSFGRSSADNFWIKLSNGKRETSSAVFPKNSATDELVKRVLEQQQIKKDANIELALIGKLLAEHKIELEVIKKEG